MVMTSYKCPECSGKLDIPESGKVLISQYCETPIKPVDVFEKVQALIQ
jgi:DNA-directed RNA polymerase subunit RPC12/RpoP